MFVLRNLIPFSFVPNPKPSNLFLLGSRIRSPPLLSLHPISFSFRSISSSSPMAPTKVVAEYAKSSRSSCKECGHKISASSLRLGLASQDPRGFDVVKWHHLDCFPTQSQLFSAAEEIKGYSSLKSSDQEALKKLEVVASRKSSSDEDHDTGKDGNSESKKRKLPVPEAGVEKSEEAILKKPKPGSENEEGEKIVFSISDTKSNYKDASLPPNWKAFQTVIFREQDNDLHDSEKIAAFDFDGCLVKTSLKRSGPDAWSLLYPSIPGKLQSLYNNGYKLVIFTNESNIERWKNKRQLAVDSKVGRLDNFIEHVKVPMQVFIACGLGKSNSQTEDPFRKPKTGMWRLMEEHFNSGIMIDMDQSFYVGDAAGRVGDHSKADIEFAQAIRLKFHLPEDYFGV